MSTERWWLNKQNRHITSIIQSSQKKTKQIVKLDWKRFNLSSKIYFNLLFIYLIYQVKLRICSTIFGLNVVFSFFTNKSAVQTARLHDPAALQCLETAVNYTLKGPFFEPCAMKAKNGRSSRYHLKKFLKCCEGFINFNIFIV